MLIRFLHILFICSFVYSQYSLRSGRYILGSGVSLLTDLASSQNSTGLSDTNYILTNYFNPTGLAELSIKSIEIFYKDYGLDIFNLSFDLFSDTEFKAWHRIHITNSLLISATFSNKSIIIKNYKNRNESNISVATMLRLKRSYLSIKYYNMLPSKWYETEYEFSYLQELLRIDLQFTYQKSDHKSSLLSLIKLKVSNNVVPKIAFDFSDKVVSYSIELKSAIYYTDFSFSFINDFGFMYSISIAILF